MEILIEHPLPDYEYVTSFFDPGNTALTSKSSQLTLRSLQSAPLRFSLIKNYQKSLNKASQSAAKLPKSGREKDSAEPSNSRNVSISAAV